MSIGIFSRIMAESRMRLLRTLTGIVVLIALYAFIFTNLNLNLTGLVPSPVATTFENIKLTYRGASDIIHRNENKSLHTKTRTLTDVYKRITIVKSNMIVNNYKYKNSAFDILWYTKPNWLNVTSDNIYLTTQCTYTNCRMSTNKSKLHNVSAVIFTLTEDAGFMPPVTRKQRNPDQAWIFFYTEAPVHHFQLKYRHGNWRNTMNWSMSYHLDADVFRPYGYLETKSEITEKNYSTIFHSKTKFAAWAVSHCGAKSRRDEFVSELASHGVEVDIFGKCTNRPPFKSEELRHLINKEYKFYLSFENSFCKDYVTEKFFSYYKLDVVLIVRGGLDYDKSLPNDTFINSAHFNSAKDLARFMLEVGSSEASYTKYLRNKDRYTSHTDPVKYTCGLCEKLNNLNDNRKAFDDHVTFIHKETCWAPTDISTQGVSMFLFGLSVLLAVCICFTFMTITCKKN